MNAYKDGLFSHDLGNLQGALPGDMTGESLLDSMSPDDWENNLNKISSPGPKTLPEGNLKAPFVPLPPPTSEQNGLKSPQALPRKAPSAATATGTAKPMANASQEPPPPPDNESPPKTPPSSPAQSYSEKPSKPLRKSPRKEVRNVSAAQARIKQLVKKKKEVRYVKHCDFGLLS